MTVLQLCAWCEAEGVRTVLQEGEEPASHGICAAHAVIFLKDVPRRPVVPSRERRGA
jgi:hypothetical protein